MTEIRVPAIGDFEDVPVITVFVKPGDVVVTTPLEHNAVMRPLNVLRHTRGIEAREIPAARDGTLDLDVARGLLKDARLLAVTAASNVLGTATPLQELVAAAHDAGAHVLVDAAQAAGTLPLDVAALGIDLLALTGHKALLGPQGIGALWVRPGLDIDPLLTGGTGGDSLDPSMPAALPDRLEAGTLNAPGIVGLKAALEWLREQGIASIHAREMGLKQRLHEALSDTDGIRVLTPPAPDGVPIVTFTADAVDPATLAARLDREHGVLARPGLHCAPGAHRLLGTATTGALRLSLGWATTETDVVRAVAAVRSIVAEAAVTANATSH